MIDKGTQMLASLGIHTVRALLLFQGLHACGWLTRLRVFGFENRARNGKNMMIVRQNPSVFL